jgi:lactosylceramide 4-alpha-galactosyltransferase
LKFIEIPSALANPHMKIFVSFIARLGELSRGRIWLSSLIETVLSYPNVRFNYFNYTEFSVGTPLEDFIKSDKLFTSNFKTAHASDIFRYLLLWRFSGTYLDTDMIVRKKLDSIPANFACDETDNNMNGAVLNLNGTVGRTMAEKFIKNLVQNFNGSDWGSNGPKLITRVLHEVCQTNSTSEMVKMKECGGFHVLQNTLCYPISGNSWLKLLNESFAEESMKRITDSDSIVVHFWNNLSKHTELPVTSNSAYVQLAKQHCPKVMKVCGKVF